MLQPLFDFGFWQDFASNGLATLLGAIFGIPIALWLSRYQEYKIERERKEKILVILWEELRYNLFILKKWKEDKERGDVGEYLCFQLRVESWNAFSDGGELEWIKDPILLNYLAQSYFSVRKTSFLSEKRLEGKLSPNSHTSSDFKLLIMQKLLESIDEAIESLLDAIEFIYQQIPRD